MPEKGSSCLSLDEAVDHFNLERWLEDFAATGAEWVILTLGQNTGHYLSPNSIITANANPGACSQRDSRRRDGASRPPPRKAVHRLPAV